MRINLTHRKNAISFPIFGSEDGDGEGGDEIDVDEDGDGDGDDENGDKGKEKPKPGDRRSKKNEEDDTTDFSHIEDPKDRRIAELSDESAKRRRQLRAAEKELEKKANDDKAKEREKLKGDERIQAELKDRDDKIDALTNTLRKNLLETAILKDGAENKKRGWHSTKTVIPQIDLEAIDFDFESGSIEGIGDELDRIAKEHEYLTVPKKSREDEDKGRGGREQQRRSGPSGRQPGGAGSQRQDDGKSREQELAGKFPYLARRIG